MAKKKLSVCAVLLMVLQGLCYAQIASNAKIEEVQRLSFGQPFLFFRIPKEMMQVAVNGMSDMLFVREGLCLINGGHDQGYFVYDQKWNNIGALPSLFGDPFSFSSARYVFLCNDSNVTHIWVYDRNDLTKAIYRIEAK